MIVTNSMVPPIYNISCLNVKGAVAVYALLYESAMYSSDKGRKALTTNWSVKGMADTLLMGKSTVIKALDALMNNGFIAFDSYQKTGRGSPKKIYRVTPVEELTRQHELASKRELVLV